MPAASTTTFLIVDHLGPTTSLPFGFRCPPDPDVGVNVGSPCPPGQVVHLTAAYALLAGLTPEESDEEPRFGAS